MTEEEALTKTCCGPVGCGYFKGNPRHSRWCAGSECMAWRVIHRLSVDNPMTLKGAGQSIDTSHGYCGLAGRP